MLISKNDPKAGPIQEAVAHAWTDLELCCRVVNSDGETKLLLDGSRLLSLSENVGRILEAVKVQNLPQPCEGLEGHHSVAADAVFGQKKILRLEFRSLISWLASDLDRPFSAEDMTAGGVSSPYHNCTLDGSRTIIQRLKALGIIEKIPDVEGRKKLYRLTLRGNLVAQDLVN